MKRFYREICLSDNISKTKAEEINNKFGTNLMNKFYIRQEVVERILNKGWDLISVNRTKTSARLFHFIKSI